MALDAKELYKIDERLRVADSNAFSHYKVLIRTMFTSRKYKDSTAVPEDFDAIPLYWCMILYHAIEKMIAVYPGIQFVAIKNVNYGIRIHHTSTTDNLNALNKIKLDLANKIDEEIIERVRNHYKRG